MRYEEHGLSYNLKKQVEKYYINLLLSCEESSSVKIITQKYQMIYLPETNIVENMRNVWICCVGYLGNILLWPEGMAAYRTIISDNGVVSRQRRRSYGSRWSESSHFNNKEKIINLSTPNIFLNKRVLINK